MRPDAPKVLAGVAAALRTRVLPHVQDPFALQTLNTGAGLIDLIAQEFDGAAARLVEENAALRALFAAAIDVVTEPELRGRLAQFSDPRSQLPTDLRVSALQEANDELRRLLIDLQSYIETTNTPTARRIEQQIWDELQQSTRRRHLAR